MEDPTAPVQNIKAFVFHDYIQQSKLPEEIRTILLRGSIRKVEISTKLQSWSVYFALDSLVLKAWLEQLAQEISTQVTGLKELAIIPVYNKVDETPQQAVEAYWPEILHSIKKQSPVASNWLQKASRQWTADTLCLVVENIIGEAYLRGKGWLQAISNLVIDELGLKIRVELEVTGNSSTTDWLEEQQAAEITALLEARTREQTENKKASSTQNQPPVPLDGVLKGKLIKGDPVLLRDFNEEDKNVIVQGRIINLEIRALKSGQIGRAHV